MTDLIGMVAGFCTTLAFLPQVIQVWRTRSVADISLGMYSTFVFGVCMWLVYGIVSEQIALIVTNVVTLGLSGSVLTMKLIYRNRDKRRSGTPTPGANPTAGKPSLAWSNDRH